MRLPRTSLRGWLIATVFVVSIIGVWQSALWYGQRAMRHSEAAYNAEMLSLQENQERELRTEISRIVKGDENADRVFVLLRTSRLANESREVESWVKSPHSSDRTAVALKWARFAADEAAYMASLHRRWGQDLARGLPPHHITDREIEPLRMPIGWTPEGSRLPGS